MNEAKNGKIFDSFNCSLLIDATDLKFSETVQTNAFPRQQLNHNHFNTFPAKLCQKPDQKTRNNFSNISHLLWVQLSLNFSLSLALGGFL